MCRGIPILAVAGDGRSGDGSGGTWGWRGGCGSHGHEVVEDEQGEDAGEEELLPVDDLFFESGGPVQRAERQEDAAEEEAEIGREANPGVVIGDQRGWRGERVRQEDAR